MKTLIVEDDSFLLSAYRLKLEGLGYEIKEALDGAEALKILEWWTPELVILDLMLPKMDGFDFLTKMKADDRWKNVPVLVASNLGQREDIDRAMALGAAGYVVKSDLSLEDLVTKINALLPKK
ncbi:MAG: hypothetical protein UW35_C0013G0020 [Candidatus Collierbacteria bacterium GW2011_GWF2_44_15]|uniref:Response regulatory domain-containing protein n=5 Tax=Candidatus Collieribacteriota TaxID=1752725 RepID=A0A0G1JRE8_9BACT|nr:MAG: hypothetical protein UW23_C0018G0003 [Candidatus Collierbacteria bacterium GW2011_GWA1_44_12]KKT38645.1 MAG: hypothetical protein UW26_C0015G0010 [Candidatus Collierbacteria bacterium GW2011_GWF1_44_12]KKT46497.1 MAG: hypothetical protein UW35_C0013G0020 [Candidatus Collierbacteria bacterium GW2011_GWF2_44_15]KKT98940.1 MAG: hypothetical protein UW99_C0013G0016 [Candidatus Collierbacteria bacterium GW2011_GWC2_45_15]KKU28374.1 MAG: hypothetical protein UX41_C0037G0004 [Candidatus Collie